MGIKHLFADMGMNEELKSGRTASMVSFVIAAILNCRVICMGDVLMIKNDSGIKSATGLTGSGSRDWIIQRISAVVLAVYSVVLLGFFLTHGDVSLSLNGHHL